MIEHLQNTSTYCPTTCRDKRGRKLEQFAWKLREQLARRWSGLVWGGSFTFESENDEIENRFAKFSKLNQLENQLAYIERSLSMYGRVVVVLNKTITGEIMLNIANPNYYNGVGKVVLTPQVAVLWQNYTIGNVNYIVKTKMTTSEVINEVYGGDQDRVYIVDNESKILKDLQLLKRWKHNLGFIPLVEMFNIPNHQFWNNQNFFEELTDWYCGYHYETALYKTLENLLIETKFNHSRAYIENASQDLIKQIEKRQSLEYDGIDFTDFIVETENGAKVNIQTGQGDFTKYTNAYNDLMDLYWKASGMSRFSEGGGAQKTVAETATVRSQMIESVNQRISFRTSQVNDLIRKMLAIYGLVNYWELTNNDFTFTINGNVLEDETTFIDNQLKLFQNNCSSPIKLIQKLYKVNSKEAQKYFEEMKQFNESNNVNMSMDDLMMDGDGESEDGFNKTTGQHTDPSKRGVAS